MKKTFKISALLIAFGLISCGPESNETTEIDTTDTTQTEQAEQEEAISEAETSSDLLVGKWVEPNPISEDDVQGFELLEDGSAKSINMATLLYKGWSASDNQVTLIFESVGNQVSQTDTVTYEIIELDESKLVIKSGDLTESYTREE